jgi:hypothetical protein
LALTLAALVLAFALVAPAAATMNGAKSRVEIGKLRSWVAKGTVESADPSCERGRVVVLFTYEGYVSDRVGETRSNSRGEWKLTKSLDRGKYFAKVESTNGCRYDVSRNKRI